MPDYSIVFTRSARKELESLSRTEAGRILDKIVALSSNPRPSGCKKLMGHTDLWRVRVGDYRVIYGIDDNSKLIDVTIVRHRSDAYR